MARASISSAPTGSRKLDGAVEVALHGATLEIDAGRVAYRSWSGEAEEGWFFNAAGVGMSGAVAKRTNESSKALGGKVSYLWSTLAVFARWRNTDVRVSVDDEVRAGRARSRRRQRPLSGRRDDAHPRGRARRRPLRRAADRRHHQGRPRPHAAKIYRGTHLPHPKAGCPRLHRQVDADVPLPVQLDGEQPGTTPVRFEVVPRALRLRVPV